MSVLHREAQRQSSVYMGSRYSDSDQHIACLTLALIGERPFGGFAHELGDCVFAACLPASTRS
jgi:hypothetical protein